jgi:DNA ligase-1
MKRYFEFVDDKSSKFWEISREGASVTVRFGRIGANGQTQTKTFADEPAAKKHADKLIEEKTGKGYVEK